MVLLKPGKHENFVRNVLWNSILYRGFMFCSVFYFSKLFMHTTSEDGGKTSKEVTV
jgi:hypothetical protein